MVAKREDLLEREDEFLAVDWDGYCEAIRQLHIPRFSEIPDFSLYMDQLIGFVGKQVSLFAVPNEKPLTASMVNNYVKMRLVPQPKAKRYEPLHVAYLICVCILKRLYSMSDIEQLISLDVQHRFQVPDAYDKFIDVFEESLRTMFCGAPASLEVGGMKATAQPGAFGLVLDDPASLTDIDRDYVLLATSAASKIYIEQVLVAMAFKQEHEKAEKARSDKEKREKAVEEAEKEKREKKLDAAAKGKSAKSEKAEK